MIKIVKDKNEKYVTKGAYENFYKPLGYNIVNDGNKSRGEVDVKKEVKEEVKEEVISKDNNDKGEKKSQKVEEFKKR